MHKDHDESEYSLSNTADFLKNCIAEYEKLLNSINKANSSLSNSNAEDLISLSNEIANQQSICQEVDTKIAKIENSLLGNPSISGLLKHYETLITKIVSVNLEVTRNLRSNMVIKSDDIAKLRKTIPALSGYLKVQSNTQSSVISQKS